MKVSIELGEKELAMVRGFIAFVDIPPENYNAFCDIIESNKDAEIILDLSKISQVKRDGITTGVGSIAVAQLLETKLNANANNN